MKRLLKRVRRLLYLPTDWHVAGGYHYPGIGGIWWAESNTKAGHYATTPFLTRESAELYCMLMNRRVRLEGRRVWRLLKESTHHV